MQSIIDQLEDGSVIQLVDFIVHRAIAHEASDIHCESTQQGLRIRYRIDGLLYDQPTIEKPIMHQVISRLKVLSHIDITEKRIPQDGKFRIIMGAQTIDLRVATFPSLYGEKVVIRILDNAHTLMSVDQLGFNTAMLHDFNRLMARSHGFFLATGPTGSGKTTTLYAALSTINTADKNIITLEDPVEYNIQGITQGQIYPEAGFTFEKGMRALLRQDPDVVMVGEIRDRQTAQIALQAALTGHLVLSTLHTADAVSVIMRLMDMGIEPFLINAALTGVLAQRLARKICEHCRYQKEADHADRLILEKIGASCDRVYQGAGCSHCLQLGYKGRVGIFELLILNNSLHALIIKQPSYDALFAQAQKDGMKTLLEDGMEKVKQGIISVQELARVVL